MPSSRSMYVLDAGALIALEKGDGRMVALFREAAKAHIRLVVPTTVLGQVWRHGGRQARLAKAMQPGGGVEFAPLDEAAAKAVGERLAESGTTDLADAHVVNVASRLRVPTFTSDPGDLRHLWKPIQLIVL